LDAVGFSVFHLVPFSSAQFRYVGPSDHGLGCVLLSTKLVNFFDTPLSEIVVCGQFIASNQHVSSDFNSGKISDSFSGRLFWTACESF